MPQLSSTGDLSVTADIEKVLSKHDGPRDLSALVGKHLYIAVLVQEDTGGQQLRPCSQPGREDEGCCPARVGGISQEAEFAAVQFVKSPYRLSLVSTPPFIKPGLPYNVQVRAAVR